MSHVALMLLIDEDSNWFKQPHFHNRVNDQTITKYIQDEPNFFIIVQDKDIIVGCIYIKLPTEEKECAGFGLLSVHSKYQRQGISKYLISQTESFLQHNSQSIKKIRIEVVNLQTHLLEIYKKMGFEVVGKCEWEDMGLSKSDVCVDSFFYILEKSIYIQQQ